MDVVSLSNHLRQLPFLQTDDEEFELCVIGYKALRGLGNIAKHNIFAAEVMAEARKKHTKRHRYTDLSIFLNLPLDLIHEMFGYLHPIDIYHIAQTNKTLRKTVLTRHATSLWNLCFQRDPSLPKCPPDMTEPQWTSFLFGPNICDNCSLCYALPDFVYRKRVCPCTTQIFRDPDAKLMYDIDDPIWELVPSTRRQAEEFYWGDSFDFLDISEGRIETMYNYYQLSDLQEAAQRLEELQDGDPMTLSAFKKMMTNRATRTMEHANICNQWAHGILEGLMGNNFSRCSKMAQRIEDRLKAAGHDEEDILSIDITNVLFYDEHFKMQKLTRRAWRTLKPSIMEMLVRAKEQRLATVRKSRLATRGQVIRSIYLEYQKSLDPTSWSSFPDYEDLLEYGDFYSLFNNPEETTITIFIKGCRSAVYSSLPGYLDDWRQSRQNYLRCQLQEAMLEEQNWYPQPLTFSVVDELDLTVSIFTCQGCVTHGLYGPAVYYFGWDDVVNHVRCKTSVETSGKSFLFCREAAIVTAAVVSFLGLNSREAKISDLDKTEARLLCSNCRGQGGRKVYTWREYVVHAVEMRDSNSHRENSCDLLTLEATELVRLHEDVYPYAKDKAWSCAHCAVHFLNFVPHRHAVKHVKEKHSIVSPTKGKDFFHYNGLEGQHTPRKPFLLLEFPPAEFRCALCPNKGNRLYQPIPLSQHLLDKHEISKPVLGDHYAHVELLLCSMPIVRL